MLYILKTIEKKVVDKPEVVCTVNTAVSLDE